MRRDAHESRIDAKEGVISDIPAIRQNSSNFINLKRVPHQRSQDFPSFDVSGRLGIESAGQSEDSQELPGILEPLDRQLSNMGDISSSQNIIIYYSQKPSVTRYNYDSSNAYEDNGADKPFLGTRFG